jgi:hypothetical protein
MFMKSGGFLRKFFYTSLRILLGFFANLRRICEGVAKKGKLCLCFVPMKISSKTGQARGEVNACAGEMSEKIYKIKKIARKLSSFLSAT